jgi:hypothetical protein
MPRVIRRATALRDLAHHFAYLATQAGLATADRFLEEVYLSQLLAAMHAAGRWRSASSPVFIEEEQTMLMAAVGELEGLA